MPTNERNIIDSPWLTPLQAAVYLGIALGTLRNLTSARVLPFARRRHIVRYHRDALDRWLSVGACPGRRTFADQHAASNHDDNPRSD